MSFKPINLREMRKLRPDLPDCCQRCQLFSIDPERYRNGQLKGQTDVVIVVDNPDAVETEMYQYGGVTCAVQCPFPAELRNKTGLIPTKYVHLCSQFLKEDIAGAEVIAAADPTSIEACKEVVSPNTDVIPLVTKKGINNPNMESRFITAINRELRAPTMLPMSTMLPTIDNMLVVGAPIQIGLDFEWNPAEMYDNKVKPHTVGIAVHRDHCAYAPLDSTMRDWLKRMAANPKVTFVGHDVARAEIQRLFDLGIHDIKCGWEDTMTTTWELVDRAGNVSLKELCYQNLPIQKYWGNMYDDLTQYNQVTAEGCANDAWASLWYLQEISDAYSEEMEQMEYAHSLDMRMLLPTAYAMWKGIGLSGEHVQKRMITARERVTELSNQLYDMGVANPNAPASLLDFFHHTHRLKLKSTDSKLLQAVLENEHTTPEARDAIQTLLDYRVYNTVLTRYLVGELVNTPNGIVHTYMAVAKANTGRPSYSSPNIANIPADIRDIFESTHKDRGTLLTYDRGQSEYRCLAYLAQHKELIQSFMNGVDIHTYASEKVGIPRTPCKTLNFAYLYYAQDATLIAELRKNGVPEDELQTRLDKFKGAMLSVRDWQERFIRYCYRQKPAHVMSPNGRRGYRLRPTTIVNFPVQSWSSDLNKETLLYFFNEMRKQGMESHIWCEFYDGTEIDAVNEEIPAIQAISKEVFTVLPDIMELGIQLPFPLEEKIHGRYWGG